MSTDATALVPRKRRWLRMVGFFFVIAAVCGITAWLVWPRTVSATSLFQVQIDSPSVFWQSDPSVAEWNFEIVKKTQLALLKSKFLLTSAVRNPSVGGSPVFAGISDPVAWLQDHLEVGYPQNGEILEIQLRGPVAQADDLVQVVDAIAEAYQKEVLSKERQRVLAQRDMMERNLQNLNQEIKRKYEDYLDIAKGMGKSNGDTGDVRQQLDLQRLDRVEEELAQLEREQLKSVMGSDGKESKFAVARMKQLQERQTELQKSIEVRAERSVELETRREELNQLKQIANDMSSRLEKMDVDLELPSRILLVQPALIDSEKVAKR